MGIPDGVNRPICYECLDRPEPPWYPNNRQRSVQYFKLVFQSHRALSAVAAEVASFLAAPYKP